MTQQYPAAPQAPAGYAAPVEDPGKTLGIVGFVLAFLAPVVGIILSAIARKNSRAAGFDNQLAKWGLILGIVFTAIGVVVGIIYFIAVAALVANGTVTSTY